jgi:cytochrome d ubiquinol oxidase subunit I
MEDALLLARAQFGLNIGFHIFFPPSPSASPGSCWVSTQVPAHEGPGVARHLPAVVKIFALSFAMGVVSGIVMSFQFGTNWPGYMNSVGAIAGPLLAYEVLTAFFSRRPSSA